MARRLNTFVYEEAVAAGLPAPYFPVYAQDYYGQCAEDLIVCSLLRAIAFRFGTDISQERYLEIGGNHPIATSSSYLLHRALGMRGVIVEANPRLIDDLRRARPDGTIVFGAVQALDVLSVQLSVSNASELSSLDRSFVLQWDGGRVGERELVEVPALRINDLIASHLEGRAPAFLAIDTEGTDLDIIGDLNFDLYRPALIQIEPSDHHIPDNARRMVEVLAAAGYVLAARTDFNLIFIDATLWNDKASATPATLTTEIALQKAQIDLQRSQRELEALRPEVDTSRQVAAQLGEELAASRRRADELAATALQEQADLGVSQQRVAALENELVISREQLISLEQHLSDSERESEELRAAAGLMKGSRSWRWTAPMRQAIRSWRALRQLP